MNILVTGANGQLGNEMRIVSQNTTDHYIFTGSQAEQFAQVGNAVPPLLAEAIGLAMKSILQEIQ